MFWRLVPGTELLAETLLNNSQENPWYRMEVDDLMSCQLALLMWVVSAVYIQKKMLFDHTFSKRVMLLSVTYLLGVPK